MSKSNINSRGVAATLTLLVASMATTLAPVQAQTAAPGASPAVTNVVSPTLEYRLGSGDVLRVLVYQNPDLTLETRVNESGTISFPLVGAVTIGGLTVPQAEKAIADGLRNGNFVKQPQVTILLTQVRGNQASVLGMVNRPGRYPLESADMRLSDLLATAGGVAVMGSDMVVITGERNGKAFRLEVDLPLLFAQADSPKDILVKNGDTVWVERQPTVYIYGEVQRPGTMRLERDMTLLQALATGGGLTPRGTEKGIRVHRKGPDGKVQVITPSMDDKVQHGDVVYVKESLF